MKKIYVDRHGRFTKVSNIDYPDLIKHQWHVHHDGRGKYYVCRTGRRQNGKAHRVYIHRQITACPEGLVVDHINGDPFDNRRENLRVCTQKMNQLNCVPWGTVQYRGVSRIKVKRGSKAKQFRARIAVDEEGGTINIGMFTTAKEAALAYDKQARKYFGAFAYQNFPVRFREKEEKEENDIPF